MFCKNCGASIADGSVTCGFCGTSLIGQPQSAPQQPMYNQNIPGQPAPQQPMYNQNIPGQPAPQQPMYNQNIPGQPAPQQPMYNQNIPGQPAPQQPMYNQNIPGQPAPQQPMYNQNIPGQPAPQQPMYNQNIPGQPFPSNAFVQPNLPMNWYKFLIYFSLIAGAVVNILSALSLIMGTAYESDFGNFRELVYEFYDGLFFVEMLNVVILVTLAVLCIVTRTKLAKYKKDGPKSLSTTYTVNAIGSAIVFIGYLLVLGDNMSAEAFAPFVSSSISGVITSIILIFANKTYFDKRMHLFVN